jgi:predicted transcriptional regulator of viral defense system
MRYPLFKKAFEAFPVFSTHDIQKRFPDFDGRRLVEWQQKGYLQKIKRGYYCFEAQKKDEHFLYHAANKIYSPSYVSFESALSYYSFIPEGVFLVSSATTKNTATLDGTIGTFVYRHLQPKLFFGYRLITKNGVVAKMAEPEKGILDYLYLNKLNSLEEIRAMRFNELEMHELLDLQKMDTYAQAFGSKVLIKRVNLLKSLFHA